MLKVELEAENKRLKAEIEDLEMQLDNYAGVYVELEEQVSNLTMKLAEYQGIKDLDNFIFMLKNDDLYSYDLEQFIKYYTRYHN